MKKIIKLTTPIMSVPNYFFRDIIVLFLSFTLSAGCFANPVMGNVGAGNVSVQQAGDTTTINQSSQKAVINWQSFNINKNETTHFQQPAGGIILNRIDPHQGVSSIYGKLTSTGQIILSNPAGIYFGPSAFVNVGGLIATTGHLSDRDFLNGQYHFTNNPAYSGAIINEGQIIAAQHGLIALVAPGVINNGLIQAKLGHVVLASGNAFTLNFAGNDLISFNIDEKTLSRGVDRNGNVLPDGVKNTGRIMANGGSVLITAAAAQGVLDRVINIEGVVSAKSVYQHNGEIIISGSPNSGVVRIAGKLNASGKHRNQQGGTVTVTGQNILLDDGALIDVSGDIGGGNIFIGGNYQGKGPLPNSNAVVMAPSASLNASALRAGNGGNIILWSDNATKAYGTILAMGGSESGNGGFVETSSHNFLDIAGMKVNLTATYGTTGTWLLDPINVTISTSATSNGSFNGSNPNVFTPSTSPSNILNTDIQNNLASANVTITTGSTGTDAGNITVNAPITWSSSNTLLLQAANAIFINDTITATNGTLALSALVGGGANVIPNATTGVISVNQLNLLSGSVLDLNATGTLGSTANINVASGAEIFVGFGNATLANTGTITLNGSGPGGVGAIVYGNFANTILNNNIILASSSTIGTFSTIGPIFFNGVISGGASANLSFVGGRGAIALGGNNTYFGATSSDGGGQGSLRLTNPNALGNTSSTTISNASSLVIGFSNATLANTNPILVSGTGNTGQGTIFVTLGNTNVVLNNPIVLLTDSNFGISSGLVATLNGTISGAHNLTVGGGGTGTYTFGGSNIYTGTTTIGQGTLSLANVNALSSSPSILVGAGTTLDIAFSNATLANTNPISISGTGTSGTGAITVSGTNAALNNAITMTANSSVGGTGSLTFNSPISGAFNLTKSGTSTINFNAANTYTGTTTIGAGTLRLLSSNVLGSTSGTTIASGGTLDLNFSGTLANTNAIQVAGTGVGGNGAVISTSAGTATLSNNIVLSNGATFGGTGNLTLNGVLSGTGGLVKTNTGVLTLSNSNTYTGGTTVTGGGILNITADNVLGAAGTGITLNNGTIKFSLASNTMTTTRPITLGAGGGTLDANGFGWVNFNVNNFILLSGIISGTGSLTFINSAGGPSNIALGANNTYSGGTIIQGGSVNIGSGATTTPFGSGTITIPAGASFAGIRSGAGTTRTVSNTLNLNGDITVGRLTNFTGPINLGNNVTIFSDNPDGVASSFPGGGDSTFSGVISGPFNLTYANGPSFGAGAAAFILSGNNTYSGATAITGGTVRLNSTGALGNTPSVSVLSGGTIDMNYSGTLLNAAPITLNGVGANSIGALVARVADAIANNPIILASNTTMNTVALGGSGLILNGPISGSGNLSLIGTGFFTFGGNNTYTGTTTSSIPALQITTAQGLGNSASTTINSGGSLNLVFNNATLSNTNPINIAGTGNLNVGVLYAAGSNIVLNNAINLLANVNLGTVNSTNSIALNGPISGAFSINKVGAGSYSFGGSNTYSGATTVSAGTLSLANVAALGNTPSTTVANGATLDFNYNGTLTNASNITIAGTGVGGLGVITTTGSNMVANNNVIMSGNSTIGGNGSLQLNGIVSGAFNLTKLGTGTLTLGGVNTYSGTTNINAGVLNLANLSGLGNTTGTTVANGTALTFSVAGTLANSNSITLNGSGISSTGALISNSGDNILSNNIVLASTSVINDPGTLNINGIVSGAGGLTKIGAGTMVLNNTNAYSGATTVSAGTLSLASIGALGNTTSTTMANGTTLNMNYVGTLTNANPISLGGTGVGGTGALTGTAAGSVANNPISLTADSLFTVSGNLTLNGTINGAANLDVEGAGTLTVGGNVGNSTPLTSILSNTNLQVNNSAIIITQNNQTYNNLVTLLSPATFSMVGTGSNDMRFNGLAGSNNLTLTSSAAGNYNYFINGPVTLANINVAPNAGSSNNSLHLNNVGVQNWNVNSTDLGNINIGGVSGSFNFSNISSAYAGTDATSNFIFAANSGHISKLIDGGSLANLNTLDHSAFTQSVIYNLVGDIFNGNFNDGIGTTTFNHFNNIAARGANNDTLFANTIYLPNKSGNTVTISSLNHGFVNDPLYYDGIKTFVSLTGQDKAVFQITAVLRAYGANSFIANINGVDMYFINFPFAQASGSIAPPVSPIINSSLIGPTTNQDAQMNYFSQLQAINVIQGLEQFNRFSWNDAPAKFLFGADCSKLSGSGCCTGKYCQSSCVWQRD